MNSPETVSNGAGGATIGIHRFGRWHFEPGTGDLSDGTTTIRLEPQVARLLAYFLQHQDTLISRDELMAAVWDNRVVSDHAVNRCISILRNKLSPQDRNAYIETVVRRGFVSHFPPPPDDAEAVTEAGERRRHPIALALALAGVAVLVLLGTLRVIEHPPPPGGDTGPGRTPMVAVLPFVSAGLAGQSEFFARGIHDDLLTQLAQLQSMRVISRTSVSGYRDDQRNLRKIGRELGADAILEGGVQRIGEQIRINVQLIDVATDAHLWARQYDRELTPAGIFDIQADIARSIAAALHSTLTRRDASQLAILPTDNMAAYRAYHEAMELRDTQTIAAPAYVAALERAVALDPDFIRARAELVGSLSYINMQNRDPESIRRLENQLEQIRALAPRSSEYLIAQSYYTYYILKEHDRAFHLIRQAQDLRPSDPQVLELQSWIQRRQGDLEGRVESLRQARTLDPRNPTWTVRLAFNLVLVHRYEEAVDEIESASVDSFGLAVLRSLLRVRDHGQPSRMLSDLLTLQSEYGVPAEPFDLWEAHIAARDYDGAIALLDALRAGTTPVGSWTPLDVPTVGLARLITERFLGVQPSYDRTVAETKSAERDFAANVHLATAYVRAAEGEGAETRRLVRTWFREIDGDLAERVTLRHHACRALGMAAAVSAALECLRSGFEEPSQAAPFLEPYLPYYDPIRTDPRFVEFVAALRRSAAGARAPTG